ncbi:hypothetical protein HID58_034149 [Brassica napus]|uniref:Uncharacterized protein n=1 Tax=Brassica napus TaxID=3708 RepID=A0ABQ8C1B1_BRANA|nr:hypothetical protein HID58_034149 [Brassica napus]
MISFPYIRPGSGVADVEGGLDADANFVERFGTSFGSPRAFKSAFVTKKGNNRDKASKFAPSRGVLLVARGNLPRVYYPSFCFLPPSGFPTFVFSFSTSRMKSKPDLALDSSSIGGRVRSKKQRSSAGPSESMDSSGSSLDLTAEVENSRRAVTSVASPSLRTNRFLPVGPLSSIGVEEVAIWRGYEVSVYEGFFESGFRDRVPSVVAKVSEALEISSGQLNPPSWKLLIALQNLGDLEGLTIGVAEVMYYYAITPLNGGERRYHLHPRGGELPVQEVVKKERMCSGF